MTAEPSPGPSLTGHVDLTVPNAARMYDYYLGGAHNFAADRALADQMLAIAPQVATSARANRGFLRRAVRYCLAHGVRQYLDLGSGIPTVGHVHEVAQQVYPDARVAYVDNEPVAVAATHKLLGEVEHATITAADLRDPAVVLAAPGVAELLDFSQPVAVLAVSVLHFMPDAERPAEVMAGYRQSLVPGSFLAISHATGDVEQAKGPMQALYKRSSNPVHLRTREQVAALLPADVELVDPGVTFVEDWRPEPGMAGTERTGHFYAALARVP